MHDEHYLAAYGRLKPEATLAAAQRRAERSMRNVCAAPSRATTPTSSSRRSPALAELVGDYSGRCSRCSALSASCCSSPAPTSPTCCWRAALRAPSEIAVRAALGAGRGRIARQLLTESVVLALAAAVAGLALAAFAIQALVAAAPPGVPRLEQTAIDPVVLGFTLLRRSAAQSSSASRRRCAHRGRTCTLRSGRAAAAPA